MPATILPPNATALERAIDASAALRLSSIPQPLPALWNPWACPAELLPWLAWGLSVDSWESAWTEGRKRLEVARAIETQRHKGTRASVENVLAAIDELAQLVEWHEAQPRLEPHTFQIRLDLGQGGGDRSSAAFAERIVREISRVKPLRSHLELIQTMTAAAGLNILGVARTAGFVRLEAVALTEHTNFLTAENGEPLQAESGEFLELS